MRILLVLPDVVQYGGTSRFVERLLDIHARQGIVTSLLVSTDRCHPSLVSLAERYGVTLLLSPDRTGPGTVPFLTPFLDFSFSWLAVLTKRPDLIVVSTGDPGRMSVALYFPCPVLYILHSTPERRFRFLPRLYLRIGSLLRNRIMTVSKAAAEAISETMGIPRAKIAVIHNSCRSFGKVQETRNPVILTAGHLVPYKNPWVWIEVARTVVQGWPGSVFAWLGDGELLEDMRGKVKQLRLEERILLPGYVSAPSAWYQRSAIYFQPSLRESHGIAVLEAMAHGLPCVVANAGGLPESVIENETGFVCPPGDVTGLAGRILHLLQDHALRKRMGDAGRRRVARYFSATQQEKKIVALYDQLLKRNGKR